MAEDKYPSLDEIREKIAEILNTEYFRYPRRNEYKYFHDDPDWNWDTTDIFFNYKDRDKVIDIIRSFKPDRSYLDEFYPVYVFDKKEEVYYQKNGGKYVKTRRVYSLAFEVFNSSVLVRYEMRDYECGDDEEDPED